MKGVKKETGHLAFMSETTRPMRDYLSRMATFREPYFERRVKARVALPTKSLQIFFFLCLFAFFSSLGLYAIVPVDSSYPQHGVKIQWEGLFIREMGSYASLEIDNDKNETAYKGIIGRNIFGLLPYSIIESNSEKLQIKFSNIASLSMSVDKLSSNRKYTFLWETNLSKTAFHDDLDMTSSHWYGGAPIKTQLWPVNLWDRKPSAFISGDSYRGYYGGVQERYWLSSKGVSLFVDYNVPLFVGVNESGNGLLTMISQFISPYSNSKNVNLSLKYSVVLADSMLGAHKLAIGHYWMKPNGIPNERIFRHPIWSTWAHYKKGITQELVLNFAKEIKQHGFNNSQIEIDDDWNTHYGDYDFDQQKFPDARNMVQELKHLGFRVTIWVHPFGSIFSNALGFRHIDGKSIFIQWPYLDMPAVGVWWNGLGSLLDLTNINARLWYMEQLNNLKTKYGIDSFKFDGGEASWLPDRRHSEIPLDNPNDFTRLFCEVAFSSDQDFRMQEVRVGISSQHLPMFVRLMDKESSWSHDNGLKSIIPHVLTLGVIGYPFVLPDMIGGNAYNGIFIDSTVWPETELYIRWLQVTTLMPAMQFSVTPWHYGDYVTNIALKMCKLHEKYSDLLIQLAKESKITGSPIIRPLWWIAPHDPVCLVIDSQFLVGNSLLVAPVLEKGATSRDVYFPEGKWRDEISRNILDGGQWYRNYHTALEDLPHFTFVH